MSDIGSNNGRGSVKDLIMKFNTGVSQNGDEPLKVSPLKKKKKKKDKAEPRASIGDAFMQSVNRATDNATGKDKRAESQGFRLKGNQNERLSIGDSFVINAIKHKDAEERDS